jgi:hypothetical protein
MTALPPLLPGGPAPPPPSPSAVLTVLDAPAELRALPVGTRIAGAVFSGDTKELSLALAPSKPSSAP